MTNPKLLAYFDIDGCLTHDLSRRRNYNDPIDYPSEMDKVCVDKLIALQKKHGFQVVISSTQRKLHKTLEDWLNDPHNVHMKDVVFHKDWKTPNYVIPPKMTELDSIKLSAHKAKWDFDAREYYNHLRGFEIMDHVKRNGVEKFIVVDDSLDFYPVPDENFCWVQLGEENGGISHTYKDDRIEEHFGRIFNV